jgi:hypothetical protein
MDIHGLELTVMVESKAYLEITCIELQSIKARIVKILNAGLSRIIIITLHFQLKMVLRTIVLYMVAIKQVMLQ